MNENDWIKLHKDYHYWIVDLNDENDPPDYDEAADVILGWLQENCTHPIRLYGYQLASLTHLVHLWHSTNGYGVIPLEVFRRICVALLNSCNEGRLPDTRIPNN